MGQLIVPTTEVGVRVSVVQRICRAIKDQISAGLLAAGDRLPSTRSLALEWGVSRTTVTAAYEQLVAEGYLVAKQGARTQVAKGLSPIRSKQGPAASGALRLSSYGQRVLGFDLPASSDVSRLVVDFRYGDLAAPDFPTLGWKKAISAALLRRPGRLRYADPCGSLELRTALQGYLWRARGLHVNPDQIVIVNGSQQGLDLCARLLLDRVTEPWSRTRATPSLGRLSLPRVPSSWPLMSTEKACKRTHSARRVSPTSRRPISFLWVQSCRRDDGSSFWPGHGTWARMLSRTITTANIATASDRSRHCRHWETRSGSSIWEPFPRRCHRCYGWAIWLRLKRCMTPSAGQNVCLTGIPQSRTGCVGRVYCGWRLRASRAAGPPA